MNEKSKYSKQKEHSLSFEAKFQSTYLRKNKLQKNRQQFRSWKKIFKCTMSGIALGFANVAICDL